MKGKELAAVLVPLLRSRDELDLAQATELLRVAFGAETLSQKRARAGREGGRRSVESRRAAGALLPPVLRSTTEAATEPPPKQARTKRGFASEANPEANPKQTPPVSSPPLHSPSSLPPSRAKETAVVSEGSDRFSREAAPRGTTTAPRSFEEAIREPLAHRAALVLGDPTLASLLRVEQWPEVLDVATAWHRARGGVGEARVTRGVAEALCRLWSRGYLPGDVLRVARHLPTTDRFRDKVLPSCLTEEVVTIALGELAMGGTGLGRDIVRSVRERTGGTASPTPLAASLASFARGGQS